MDKNLYEILGVNKTSSSEEIKKAYRKMAMEYHPDKNPDNPEAESKFKEAASAYDILSNPEKKSQYDRFGTVGSGPGAHNGGFGGMNMNDIFSHFGDIFNGGGFQHRQRQNKGSDLRLKVSLTIDEILKGTKKKLKYKRQEKCDHCNGSPTTTWSSDWYNQHTRQTKQYEEAVLLSLINSIISDVSHKEDLGYKTIEAIIDRHISTEVDWSKITEIGLLGLDEISLKKGYKDFVTLITSKTTSESKHTCCNQGKRKS